MGNIQKLLSARYLIIDYLREHKQQCNDPKCNESVNVLAFLAHALRMTLRDLNGPVIDGWRWYEQHCIRNGCVHVDDDKSTIAQSLHATPDIRRLDPVDGQQGQ